MARRSPDASARTAHAVALLARRLETSRELAATFPEARAYQCDVADAASVQRAFDAIRSEMGDPAVVIVQRRIRRVRHVRRRQRCRLRSELAGQRARRVPRGQAGRSRDEASGAGSIVFVGAHGLAAWWCEDGRVRSRRSPRSASLAESLARQLWPAGIHVSVIIVDGVVDFRAHAQDRCRPSPTSSSSSPTTCGHRGMAHLSAALGVVFRSRGAAVRRDVVTTATVRSYFLVFFARNSSRYLMHRVELALRVDLPDELLPHLLRRPCRSPRSSRAGSGRR